MQNSDFPNLPRSWQVKTLGEVCEKISAGGDRPNDCTTEKTQENQIPIFSNGIENNGLYGYTKIPTITKPALTISARGTIGFVCVRYEPFFPIVRLICAIPNDKVLVLEFLAYALRYLIPQGEGSSIPQLTIPNFKQIKIPIPPLEIQKRIVKRLDEAFSRIESGTKHLQSAKDNLAKYKQSLLKSAFNGTLTQDCPLLQGESATPSLHSKSISQSSLRGSNATEAIHKESTDSTESSLRANEMSVAIHKKEIDCHESLRDSRNDDKDSLNGESSNLPQGWTIKTLGEIGEIVSGGTPTTSQADNFGGNIAWITPADLSNHNDKFISQGKRNISEKGLKNSSARLMPKGTILFSSRAPIGYVAIASNPLCTNQGFKSLIPNENIFSEFVYYYLLNSKSLAKSYASGTTFKEISAKSFSKLPIPIPPLETQKQIVAILERHFTSADKVSAYIESCLTKAKQLKSSLLKSTFEGKL